ncbi:hypothetical protein BKA62DRAFT_824318 [Auriculariales sp. MPI-PUGE-AT-0066]|nr:hypothetical protein BKA62DRAFT_824318 [Auriculariales sp. MPI-PUGE-AT-0066]
MSRSRSKRSRSKRSNSPMRSNQSVLETPLSQIDHLGPNPHRNDAQILASSMRGTRTASASFGGLSPTPIHKKRARSSSTGSSESAYLRNSQPSVERNPLIQQPTSVEIATERILAHAAQPRQENISERDAFSPYRALSASGPTHSDSVVASLGLQYKTAPTSKYLALANLPSSSVAASGSHGRKLVVLDLNGALVFREKFAPYGLSNRANVRSLTPRPYLQALEQYLAHESGSWCFMIWSSAQPHSVQAMVNSAFSSSFREKLLLKWNRTHFNLSQEEYHAKSVTLKDLDKPWAFLARQATLTCFDPTSTLLLDDSTTKAVTQPYNHVCITEFDDEASKRVRMRIQDLPQRKPRKRRKTQQPSSPPPNLDWQTGMPPPDHAEMLVAVIGILDAASRQNNVASWIKSGGLWAGFEPLEPMATSLLSAVARSPNQLPIDAAAQNEELPAGSGNDLTTTVSDCSISLRQRVWYEHIDVYRYWVQRGFEVMQGLGICQDPYTMEQWRMIAQDSENDGNRPPGPPFRPLGPRHLADSFTYGGPPQSTRQSSSSLPPWRYPSSFAPTHDYDSPEEFTVPHVPRWNEAASWPPMPR